MALVNIEAAAAIGAEQVTADTRVGPVAVPGNTTKYAAMLIDLIGLVAASNGGNIGTIPLGNGSLKILGLINGHPATEDSVLQVYFNTQDYNLYIQTAYDGGHYRGVVEMPIFYPDGMKANPPR